MTVQGSGKQKDDVSCTYRFDQVSDGGDPELPLGYRFVGTGSVTGQVAGLRPRRGRHRRLTPG